MSESILVVDDDVDVRQLLVEILQERGYAVLEARNGAEAVRAIRHAAIDLIVTDLVMPEQEGLETICLLHREYPQLRIMAISGYECGAYLYYAQHFGACVTLKKPFSVDTFVEMVEQVLRPQ
jgi:DNA-binding NtrC family response regulator